MTKIHRIIAAILLIISVLVLSAWWLYSQGSKSEVIKQKEHQIIIKDETIKVKKFQQKIADKTSSNGDADYRRRLLLLVFKERASSDR